MSTENTSIDWTVVPKIKEDLDQFKNFREADNERISRVGDMLRPQPEQVFWLKVRVTDVDLAQVVLSSMYDKNHGEGHSLIPGMSLEQIFIKDPANSGLTNQLRMLADMLDRGDTLS